MKNIREKISNCNINKLEKTNYENNLRETNYENKLGRTNSKSGITLIALVITIIVLLILAGVSLSMVFSQEGIFHRAENATDKYGQSKARETLELALDEAQMQKYEEGLTDEQLDNKINEIGELLPKEDLNSNNQQVIVDGSIFEIDRSVPKIVDYIGPADGVIITARVTQNGNWQNPVATVTGTITKYGGGSVTSSTATATNGVTITGFPTAGGSYTIPNITTDTDITITASADDGKPAVTKTIEVRLVRDNTPPTLTNAKAEADRMKIKISVIATDTESGVAQINYTVEPNTVKLTTGEAGSTGTISSGQVVELTASEEKEYTVTFTATDNAGNTSAPATAKATTTDSMTVAEVKRTVNANNIADYIGTKVRDYETGAIWRVFYVDPGTTEYPNGYFGDGAGTIYLKRDYDSTKIVSTYGSYSSTTPSTDAVNLMKQLNPLWREASNGSAVDLENEKMSAGFYEQTNYGSYKNSTYSTYAVGTAPIEMWCKAQNIYKVKYDTSASTIGCGIKNTNGYGYTINGGSLVHYQGTTVVTTSIERSKVITTGNWEWLASPSSFSDYNECYVDSNYVNGNNNGTNAFCPVVPLNR